VAATSLTGIFAPGSPALVESLRTLVIEPKRAVAPGEVIRAEFSFSNLGGAAATGVRVRFAHPQGVVHAADGDMVDERPLEPGERFIDTTGANVGNLEPNAQRTVSCSFRVNDTIEDGTELVFQAALVTDQTPMVASNIERIVVRSHPQLQNASTLVTISAPDAPKPGATLTIRTTIVNTGSSSAHDVVLMLPSPEHTTYVARSARIDGRVIAGLEGEAFDYDAATIVSERLGPGQSVTAEYQATIDSPLPDATRIKATGSVGSRESAEIAIASADIVVDSPVDFAGEETSFTLLCDDAVTPGMRVPMVLRAVNAGTGTAQNLSIAFELPPGLIYSPGSAHVDGQPVSDDEIAGLHVHVGALAAGRIVEVGLAGTVAVPNGGEPALPIGATLRWKGGERAFSRKLTVRVAPRFNRARNYVEADRGIAQAREDVRFTIHVFNDGTAPERNVRLRLIPGVHIEDVRIAESFDDPASTYHEPIALGIVNPHQERTFAVTARVGSKVPDRSNVSLGVVLEHDGGAIDLGSASVVVRSRPHVARGAVAWELATNDVLRPHRTVDVVLRFTNGGSDVLRDARLVLTMPPDLAVERAVDARRDRDGLVFGDVAPETTHEARLTLRLLRPVPGNRALLLDGWLHGRGISPVQFPALDIPTFAQPEFERDAQLVSAPTESVNAGERLYYDIRLRNDGDGPADRLLVRVVPTNLAVYVPSSTAINGMPVPDDSGMSQLWSQRGMVLADVNPGVELRIRWEMVVMYPLASGTQLDTRAVLEWSDGHTLALAAPTMRVQAQPALGESTAGNAISIARIFPSDAPAYEPPPLPEAPKPYTPPVAVTGEAPPRALAEVIERQALPTAPAEPTVERAAPPAASAAEGPQLASPVLYVDFTAERLVHTIKMLERSDVGGLVQHLFALRMLFPENVIGGSPQLGATFSSASRALRAPMERLFVRLRMPRLAVTGKDLEDRDSRVAMRTIVDALSSAPTGRLLAPPDGVVRVEGPVDADLVRALVPDLENAPLGAVAPWLANAHMLGGTIYHDGTRSDALAAYRREIQSVLSVLSELPMEEFHRVLTTSVNHTLDEAFAGVLDALRNAAHVASE